MSLNIVCITIIIILLFVKNASSLSQQQQQQQQQRQKQLNKSQQPFLQSQNQKSIISSSLFTSNIPTFGTGMAFSLGLRANVYGYPLLGTYYFSKTFTTVNCTSKKLGYAPANVFNYLDVLTVNDTLVKEPNVDIIYAPVLLDLTKGPVILDHPTMGTRYFSFQVTDPYGNVFDYIGSRTTGSTAARIAFKWVNDNTTGHTHMTNIKQTIVVNYSSTVLVGRFFIINDDDVLAVKTILRDFKIIPPGGQIIVPSCNPNDNYTVYNIPTGLNYYTALNNALKLYPPPPRDERIMKDLSKIGIGIYSNGFNISQFTKDEKTALIRANKVFLPGMETLLSYNRYRARNDNNGWTIPPTIIGNYGTDYLTRAGVAIIGLLANTEEEAHYRGASYDTDGNRFNSSNTYLLTFPPGLEPPVDQFWSLTLYNSQYLLPANILEPIHSVNSKKTNFIRQDDGTVVIQLSRSRPTDPTINWLPSPLTNDQFLLNLRCYNPQQPILNRTWISPGFDIVK